MRLLVLGGTHHVGRAVVETALSRGDDVTTVTRGISGPPSAGANPLYVDRTDADALERVLGSSSWDAVLDTWSGAPRVVHNSAQLLAERTSHYTYISSRSVYVWPIPVGADESAPVVDGDAADNGYEDYAVAKRGGELAVESAFGDRALIARAGLILGPYEIVGRLPWWLRRIEEGGRVLAPGPKDRPLQYVDARDLAAWLLLAAEQGVSGTFNSVSQAGHATMGGLLAACIDATKSDAELVWAPADTILAANIAPWTELPIWLPPTGEFAGLHDGDVTAAYAAGLRCRPIEETVADTWRWVQTEGYPDFDVARAPTGLAPKREAAVLAALDRAEH